MTEYEIYRAVVFDKTDTTMTALEAHHRWYGNLAKKTGFTFPAGGITIKEVKASTCPHFNDIQLHRWDNISTGDYARGNVVRAKRVLGSPDRTVSLAEVCCTWKAAAREIRGW